MTDRDLGAAVEAWGRSHREELVRDLIHMVNYPSVSEPGEGGYAFGTNCKNCADAMMALGTKYGFVPENDDYYTVSIMMPGTSGGELGILGHLDVVPAGDGWHFAPYDAIEKDDCVIGRGSSDNKGGVLMSLYVMRALKELGVEFRNTIRLICGFNEEQGMKDVEHYLQTHPVPPKYTLVCDGGWAMIVGEKGILNVDLVQDASNGNLKELYAGISANAVPDTARAVLSNVDAEVIKKLAGGDISAAVRNGDTEITALGKAGHAAFPWAGENAAYKLLRFLDDNCLVTGAAGKAVKNLAALLTDDYGSGIGIAFEDSQSGKTTCVGSILRMKDGKIIQHLDVRYAVTQESADILKALESLHTRGIATENLSYSAPRYTDPDAPVTKMLLDTVHEFLGPEYKPFTMGGGTHARKFPNALPYGPGQVNIEQRFGNAHGIDEAVRMEGLLMSMSTYAVALKRLDEML